MRDLAEKLAQAQKVQALGQLAGGIAHDFNNILQSVSGAAMLIERRPEDLERTRRLARSSIDAAARGASITQRLLSFARRGTLRAEVIATAEMLNSMREVLSHTLGSEIDVRVAVDGTSRRYWPTGGSWRRRWSISAPTRGMRCRRGRI